MRYGMVMSFALSILLMISNVWANNEPATDTQATSMDDMQFLIDERAAIQRLSAAWAHFLNNGEPAKAAALYENHISLYATFKNKIDNYNDLVKYFTFLTKKEKFRVEFNEENIRVYGATAVSSGLYTFSYLDKTELRAHPARFTFVYTLTPSGWKIVDHHSSVLPQ